MPANKNQIRRIQTIIKMMRQNRYPNYTSFIKEMKMQDIAGAYKLSSKTFQRDIADLRDEYGAPVHYDASRKGFYLSNIDWYNEDLMIEFYLDCVWCYLDVFDRDRFYEESKIFYSKSTTLAEFLEICEEMKKKEAMYQ